MIKKILIIEDHSFLRELISQKLTEEGYEVVEGIDGEEGLKKAKEEKFDLILLDLILPGIDGFNVLKEIKEDKKLNQTPVIILSNLGQKEEIDKGTNLGAQDFLIKANYTPNQIIEKIKEKLDA